MTPLIAMDLTTSLLPKHARSALQAICGHKLGTRSRGGTMLSLRMATGRQEISAKEKARLWRRRAPDEHDDRYRGSAN